MHAQVCRTSILQPAPPTLKWVGTKDKAARPKTWGEGRLHRHVRSPSAPRRVRGVRDTGRHAFGGHGDWRGEAEAEFESASEEAGGME